LIVADNGQAGVKVDLQVFNRRGIESGYKEILFIGSNPIKFLGVRELGRD